MATMSSAGGGSSMGNAGQGTRGMSASDWTRMQRLRGAKTYAQPPVTTTVANTAYTVTGSSVTGNGTNILGYAGGTILTVLSIGASNIITFANPSSTVAADSTIYFTTSFCGITAGTAYRNNTAITKDTSPYTSTIYLASDSGKTAITLTQSTGTATVGACTVPITNVDTSGNFTFSNATTPIANGYPISFANTDLVGGVTATTTYYIKNPTGSLSGTFQLTTDSGGTTLVSTATSGIPSGVIGTASAVTVNVSATAAGSPGLLTIVAGKIANGQRIVFSTSFAGVVGGVTYLVASYTSGGITFSLTDLASNAIAITNGLPSNVTATASGATFTNIYVSSPTTFSYTAVATGAPIAGQVFNVPGTVGGLVSGTNYYVTTVDTTNQVFSAKVSTTVNIGGTISVTGSAVTVPIAVTATSLGLTAGSVVTISGVTTLSGNINGTWTLSSVNASTIIFNMTTNIPTTGASISVGGVVSAPVLNGSLTSVDPASTISVDTGAVTVPTVGTAASLNLVAGSIVNISGVTTSSGNINGTWTLSSVSASTIIFNMTTNIPTTGATISAGGSVLNTTVLTTSGATVDAYNFTVLSSSSPTNISGTVAITTANTLTITSVSSNVFSCTTTAALANGQAVTTGITSIPGGLAASTTYYIANLNTAKTSFQVSSLTNGTNILSLTSATGTLTYNNTSYTVSSTAGFSVGIKVLLTAATNPLYNGTFTITALSSGSSITIASIGQLSSLDSASPTATFATGILTLGVTSQNTNLAVGQTLFFSNAAGTGLVSTTIKNYIIAYVSGTSLQVSDGANLVVGLSSATAFGYVLPTLPTIVRVVSSTAGVTVPVFLSKETTEYKCAYVQNGQIIQFDAAIGGLSASTNYYVISFRPGDNTFEVSASAGGTAIAPTSYSITSANVSISGTVSLSSIDGITPFQPIVFDTAFGGLTPGSTYIIESIIQSSKSIVLCSTSYNTSYTTDTAAPITLTTSSTSSTGYISSCNPICDLAITNATGSYVLPAKYASISLSGKPYLANSSSCGITYTNSTTFFSSSSLYPSPDFSYPFASVLTAGTSSGYVVTSTPIPAGIASGIANNLSLPSSTGIAIGKPVVFNNSSVGSILRGPSTGTLTTPYFINTINTAPYYIGLSSTNTGGTAVAITAGTNKTSTLPSITFSVAATTPGVLRLNGTPSPIPVPNQPYTVASAFSGLAVSTQYYVNTYTVGTTNLVTLQTGYANGISPTINTNVEYATSIVTVTGITIPVTFNVTGSNAAGASLIVSNLSAPIAAGQPITFNKAFCGLSGTSYAAATYATSATAVVLWTTTGGNTLATIYPTVGTSIAYTGSSVTVSSVNLSGVITLSSIPSIPIQNGSTFVTGATPFCQLLANTTYLVTGYTGGTTLTLTKSDGTPTTITPSTGIATYGTALTYGSVSSSAIGINTNGYTRLSINGVLNLSSAGGYNSSSSHTSLIFGIKNSAGLITALYIDLQPLTFGMVSVGIAGGTPTSTGITVSATDQIGLVLVGNTVTLYGGGKSVTAGVIIDSYTFYSALSNAPQISLAGTQSFTVTSSLVVSNSDLQTNKDIAPPEAAQQPYGAALLIPYAAAGTPRTLRPASNWTNYIASQTGDFITVSQNIGANGQPIAGVVQTQTKICGATPAVLSVKSLNPGANAFNRLKILS